jgi:hypothetical protein
MLRALRELLGLESTATTGTCMKHLTCLLRKLDEDQPAQLNVEV